MKNIFGIIAVALMLCLCLTACQSTPKEGSGKPAETVEVSTEFEQSAEDMFSDRDVSGEYDAEGCVTITLNGNGAVSSSSAVGMDGGRITITEEATYLISGSLDDGMIIVNAADTAKIQLVLNGASITSSTSAPIYVLGGDKVFLTLAEGSENTLTNGGAFEAIDENNIDAVIFSKQDLTVNGAGSLTVSSPAGHGIVSKDDLVIAGGSLNVTAASHALDANDSVRVKEATLVLNAGKDGIHSENDEDTEKGFVYIENGSFDIEAEGDGISAGAYMQINGGSFDILAGGGSENATQNGSDGYGQMPGWGGGMGGRPRSAAEYTSSSTDTDSTSTKAIKASGSLLINGGSFKTDSADDGIHSNTSVIVNGGSFEIKAGDDGIHADEVLRIASGSINITESYEGLEALNVEVLGGDIMIVASDDGINAAGGNDGSGFGGMRPGGDMWGGMGGSSTSNGTVVISGGTVYMNASGDGIDANGSFTMSGGHVTVCGPTVGDTAVLDYDNSAIISGGTFIGTGAAQMSQSFSDSEQGVLAVTVGNQSAGTKITLTDKNGKAIIVAEPKFSYGLIVLSSPDMVKGESYTLTVGDQSQDFEAN